jgi:hypothetical protein
MSLLPRTVRLNRPFIVDGRTVIIRRAGRLIRCTCALPNHLLTPGDLYASITNHRTGQHLRLHLEHLSGQWCLLVVDDDGHEVIRLGSEPPAPLSRRQDSAG